MPRVAIGVTGQRPGTVEKFGSSTLIEPGQIRQQWRTSWARQLGWNAVGLITNKLRPTYRRRQ